MSRVAKVPAPKLVLAFGTLATHVKGMTITNIDALSVKAGFAETDATKLQVGQPVAVSFSALRDDIRPTVAPWPAQLAMFAVLGPIGRLPGLVTAV